MWQQRECFKDFWWITLEISPTTSATNTNILSALFFLKGIGRGNWMGCNVWDNKRKIKEKNLVLFYVYECFVWCVFICAMCVPISWIMLFWFPGIIYKMLCAAMWGLNTELVLSERASRTFNHWAKFCSLQTVHIYTFKKYSLRLPYKF